MTEEQIRLRKQFQTRESRGGVGKVMMQSYRLLLAACSNAMRCSFPSRSPPSVFLASPPGIDFAGQKLVSSDSRTSTQADVTQQLVYIINIPDFPHPSHRVHFYQGDTKTFLWPTRPRVVARKDHPGNWRRQIEAKWVLFRRLDGFSSFSFSSSDYH